MSKLIDETGNKHGRLKVLERVENTRAGGARWLCKCDCGTKITVIGLDLRNGHTKSCGCRKVENLTKHGMWGTPEYRAWDSMIQRCTNPNSIGFVNYGARGLIVAERWQESFGAFYEDMGPRPTSKHSLERRNNDMGYHRSNCKWATPKQQNRNNRHNRMLTYNGKTQCLAAWAEELDIKSHTIRQRVDKCGWSVERALATPAIALTGRNKYLE